MPAVDDLIEHVAAARIGAEGMCPGRWLIDGGDVDPVLVRDEDRGDEGKEEEEDDTGEADEAEWAAREQSQEIQD